MALSSCGTYDLLTQNGVGPVGLRNSYYLGLGLYFRFPHLGIQQMRFKLNRGFEAAGR